MGSIPPELSLDVRQSIYIPKTISFFLSELTTIGDFSERMLRLDDYVKRLEDEMRKIDAFKRELPLSLLLLNDAIVTLKDESMQCRAKNVEPILEEFIPLKKDCVEDEKIDDKKERRESRDNKMNWMSSVQLWNTDGYKNNNSNNSDGKQDSVPQFIKGAEKKSCLVTDDPLRTFMPFKGFSDFPAKAIRREDKREFPVAGLSLVMPGTNNNSSEEVVCSSGLNSNTSGSRAVSSSTPRGPSNLRPQPQSARKQRRCWSPELHRRFVAALQQLGGSHVATPKQIRELMQVDGLTNDEVKSHLQKYRLHTRRSPAATAATPPNQSTVILGDLWMPQEEYSESSKHNSTSQSGSPQGPLQLAATGGSNSMEEEEEEDDDDYDD